MTFCNGITDQRKLQVIINLLKKKIPDLKGLFLIHIQKDVRAKWNKDFFTGFLFVFCELSGPFSGPCFCILAVILLHDFFFCSKLLDNFGGTSVDRTNDIKRETIFGFVLSDTHDIAPNMNKINC